MRMLNSTEVQTVSAAGVVSELVALPVTVYESGITAAVMLSPIAFVAGMGATGAAITTSPIVAYTSGLSAALSHIALGPQVGYATFKGIANAFATK